MNKTNLRDLPKDLLLMIMTKLGVKTQIEDMIKENKFSELYKNMKAMNEILEKGNKNHLIEFKELDVFIEGEIAGSSASIEINYRVASKMSTLFYINIEENGDSMYFRDYRFESRIFDELRKNDYYNVDSLRKILICQAENHIWLKYKSWPSPNLKDEDIENIFQVFINCLDHYLLYFKVY